jgi:hypothetical protein
MTVCDKYSPENNILISSKYPICNVEVQAQATDVDWCSAISHDLLAVTYTISTPFCYSVRNCATGEDRTLNDDACQCVPHVMK